MTGVQTCALPIYGEQGVDMAIRERPDIILMDIVMPNVNGFQATRMIRKNPVTTDIPVIIISGAEQMSDKIWGMRLGANDFLAKPISRTMLIGKMKILLNKKTQPGMHGTTPRHPHPMR